GGIFLAEAFEDGGGRQAALQLRAVAKELERVGGERQLEVPELLDHLLERRVVGQRRVVPSAIVRRQQAEVAAAALGLEQLREPCRVTVLSDSRYVVETMSGRFRRKTNHEWWARLDRAAEGHKISWEWIKGHAGHAAQEAVDLAARNIAAAGRADAEVLREAAAAVGDGDRRA
ncbi:MAG TPA: RNase H family protein, partial [Pyrinomonadaceae bacterium]